MVAAVRKNAIVSAAGHSRHKPYVIGIQKPGIAPAPFNKFVKRASLLVRTLSVAAFPSSVHQIGGGENQGIGSLDRVVKPCEVTRNPGGGVTAHPTTWFCKASATAVLDTFRANLSSIKACFGVIFAWRLSCQF